MTDKVTINLTRQDDGSYGYTADGEGFSMGGGTPNAKSMISQFQEIIEVIEDRAAGGSGLL